MILVDMNQVTISNLMIQMNSSELNEDMVRHMILNSLRSYKTKFSEYGELVLCYDDKHYWRREYFPNYKANRKKDRTESSLNWNELFDTLNKIRDEIKEVFPSYHFAGSYALIAVPCRLAAENKNWELASRI